MRKELVMAREEKVKNRQKISKNGSGKKENFNKNGNYSAFNAYFEQTSSSQSSSPGSSASSETDQKNCDPAGSSKSKISCSSNNFDLNMGAFEAACFSEIKRAAKVFLDKPSLPPQLQTKDGNFVQREQTTFLTEESEEGRLSPPNLLQALNLQETYIRKLIDFCQSLSSSFACLKPADKLTIVKKFFEDSLTIRCAFHYDCRQDGFPLSAKVFQCNNANECSHDFSLSPVETLVKLASIFPASKQHHLETYRKFIYDLHNELEGDKSIRDLVSFYTFLIICLRFIYFLKFS